MEWRSLQICGKLLVKRRNEAQELIGGLFKLLQKLHKDFVYCLNKLQIIKTDFL
jgi:hypothetical protein